MTLGNVFSKLHDRLSWIEASPTRLPNLTTIFISLLGVGLVHRWWQRRKHEQEVLAFASRNCCKSPVRLQYEKPFGIDLAIKIFKADRAGQILHVFSELIYSTGNTFEQIILGGKAFGTIDPLNIEAVLNSQFNDFCLGRRVDNFRALLGHGIFTQNGAEWKASRDLLRPQFMHTRSDNFDDVLKEVETFLGWVEHEIVDGVVDLQPLFFRLTLNTTMAILFGRSSLTGMNDGEEAVFAEAFNKAQHWLARRGRYGDFYWLVGGSEFRETCRTVHQYMDKIVHAALQAEQDSSIEQVEGGRYIFLQALMQRTRDPIVLRDHLLNMLLAGRDTTACLLSWTFRLLAQHPDIQDKLRKECCRLPSFELGNTPNKMEVKNMEYMEMVLREVLRLYPSVPVNARTAVRTTTLPRGGGTDGMSPIVIERGQELAYSVYSMHRSPQIWGEDADKFRPERWIGGSMTMTDVGDVGWAYLPFNAGPRLCLGRDFALLEASLATARLLQIYQEVSFAGPFLQGDAKEKQTLTLVLSSTEGCNVRLASTSAA